MLETNLFKRTASAIDLPSWKIDKNIHIWSPTFIEKLGYTANSLVYSPEFFINQLLHKDYKQTFKSNYFGFIDNNIQFQQLVQLKTSNGDYKEFICKTNEKLPVNIHKNTKIIYFIERNLKTASGFIKDDYFYYRESAQMTQTGSWYIDFIKQKSFWDYETRRILEYPEHYIPSLKKSYKYYAKDAQELAANVFFKCAMIGEPFDIEIKMKTSTGREFWARAIGKPIYDDNSDIVGVRGIFQDIDESKNKELKLKETYDIITSQNTRLVNFAHIVSHNLKSHAGNLSLLVEMIEDTKDDDEKLELLANIKSVSKSLNLTVEHLKEVATIQTNKKLTKTTVNFKETLESVKQSIGNVITAEKAKIHSDFQVEHIEYIPAYLDSILLNLITNSIKYKYKNRPPEIHIKTYKKEDATFMEIQDNGRGIDMSKFGDKLFGMYKTFHLNKDAVGIGLFLTKNQVESLGGSITAKSEVGKGTTFIICF